jgi:hypothetical protein
MSTRTRARVGVCARGVWARQVCTCGYGVMVCNVCICVCTACHSCRVSCTLSHTHVCMCVTVWICGCGSCSGAHPSLLPLPCRPPPSAFRGTRGLSDQSRGALTADSWPAGVVTTPSVCGTPPAGRARPHWRWAGGREDPPGRSVTQPPAARTACMRTGHCVCAVVCVCTHVHVRMWVSVYVRVSCGPGRCAPAGTASCCETCVFVCVRHATRAV